MTKHIDRCIVEIKNVFVAIISIAFTVVTPNIFNVLKKEVVLGTLALHLQKMFQTLCPDEWVARSEVQVMNHELRQMLGYSPQVDILLEHTNGLQRLWIEFEISRADPVANHAKFATAQLFKPKHSADTFVSMMSPDISKGKRNLAANTIWVMRYLGMQAYQTTLLPHLHPQEIKQMNRMDSKALSQEKLNIKQEIQRAITTSKPLEQFTDTAIHFVGNNMEAILNLHQWNRDISTEKGRNIWKKRTITYFVYDKRSGLFAPSKFCAYIFIPTINQLKLPISGSTITMGEYVKIDHEHKIFDGQRARKHLCKNLGMTEIGRDYASKKISRQFDDWLELHKSSINVHPNGATFILPPLWF